MFRVRQTVELNATGVTGMAHAYGHVGDANAHEWTLTVVRGGAPVDLADYVGIAKINNGVGTVQLECTISGNTATVVLPSACYVNAGDYDAWMQLTSPDLTAVAIIAQMQLHIAEGETDNPLDPGTGIAEQLGAVLGLMGDMVEARDDANEAAALANGVAAAVDGRVTAVETSLSAHASQLAEIAKADPVINVRTFGAKGDGTTDDTSAIMAAVAELTNGGTLYFPPGVYMAQSIVMIDKLYTTLVANGAIIKQIGGTNAILLALEGCQYTTLRGIFLDGNKAAHTESIDPSNDKRDCLQLRNSFFSRIESCVIRNAKHDNLRLVGYFADEDGWFYNCDECHIINCYIQLAGRHGVYIDGVCDLLIDGCNIEFNEGVGLYMGTTSGITSNNNTVSGNNFLSNDSHGCEFSGCNRTLFDANQVRANGERGVVFGGGASNAINASNFHMNGRLVHGSPGIVVAYGKNAMIQGNIITNSDFVVTQGSGIEAFSMDGLRILGNTFADNGGIPIYTDAGCEDVVIRDNIGASDVVAI
jgi:hypothetical protein